MISVKNKKLKSKNRYLEVVNGLWIIEDTDQDSYIEPFPPTHIPQNQLTIGNRIYFGFPSTVKQQTYLSLQQKAKTMWRHPWSWATSKGGGSSWTVGYSSRCSHISIQQLGLTEGKTWEERFKVWSLVNARKTQRQPEWDKKGRKPLLL